MRVFQKHKKPLHPLKSDFLLASDLVEPSVMSNRCSHGHTVCVHMCSVHCGLVVVRSHTAFVHASLRLAQSTVCRAIKKNTLLNSFRYICPFPPHLPVYLFAQPPLPWRRHFILLLCFLLLDGNRQLLKATASNASMFQVGPRHTCS